MLFYLFSQFCWSILPAMLYSIQSLDYNLSNNSDVEFRPGIVSVSYWKKGSFLMFGVGKRKSNMDSAVCELLVRFHKSGQDILVWNAFGEMVALGER